MMRIGLLSDTHGYLDDRFLKHLEKCDEIWHAGDIGNIGLADTIAKIKPLKAVYGNIDGQDVRIVWPEILRFNCEDVDVAIKHIGGYPGNYDRSVAQLMRYNPPKLFISGHSHILKVIFDKKHNLLHINPGAAGKNGMHKVQTMVMFSVNRNNITDLEVAELDKK
ncbi:MAG: metallophosphoesterase family protein [Bacteroidales bacterium]